MNVGTVSVMKALCSVDQRLKDETEFDHYRRVVRPTLEPFSARFVVRGGAVTVVEGDGGIVPAEVGSRRHPRWHLCARS